MSLQTIGDLFPSPYLRTSDIGETDLVFTIKKVQIEPVGYGDQQEDKPVIYFHETDKKFVLNKTNANSIAHLYGENIVEWIGKRFTLYTTEVSFQGRSMLGIRVRLRIPE